MAVFYFGNGKVWKFKKHKAVRGGRRSSFVWQENVSMLSINVVNKYSLCYMHQLMKILKNEELTFCLIKYKYDSLDTGIRDAT